MDHEGINVTVTTDSAAEDDEHTQAWCLTRVGKNSGWLRLFEHTEVPIANFFGEAGVANVYIDVELTLAAQKKKSNANIS